MAKVLTKELLREAIETVKEVYLEDRIPWICGYSGGKDSSATVQLVWMALTLRTGSPGSAATAAVRTHPRQCSLSGWRSGRYRLRRGQRQCMS